MAPTEQLKEALDYVVNVGIRPNNYDELAQELIETELERNEPSPYALVVENRAPRKGHLPAAINFYDSLENLIADCRMDTAPDFCREVDGVDETGHDSLYGWQYYSDQATGFAENGSNEAVFLYDSYEPGGRELGYWVHIEPLQPTVANVEAWLSEIDVHGEKFRLVQLEN